LKDIKVRTFFNEKLEADATPYERLMRLERIANGVVEFCKEMNATAVFAEEYAFSRKNSQAHALGEGGGCVKLEVWRRLNLVVVPIVASSARKTLLVKCPQKDPKSFVQYNVQRLRGPTLKWTGDEIDAFVICNAGLGLIGGMVMSYPGE
jgi:Holliday junction resolvasome RuvABC endonuclease subunit